MQWNESTKKRFNELRVKKFVEGLDDGECGAPPFGSAEFLTYQTYLEQQTATYLSPLITSLEQETAAMLQKLDETNAENTVLLRIIEQQKQRTSLMSCI